MSWALFHRAAGARPFWLATASGLALAASPVLAQSEANPAQPAEEVAGEPDLQTPDAEQRSERARFALADGKRDHVGRRIDLRDKLNVHAMTFLCDD